MFSENEFIQMQMVNPIDIDKSTLIDIQTVKINTKLPKEERILDFIRQIKNPYLFKCGELVVQSVFDDTETTLNDRLKQYFKML